ncbi:hypothetical protein VIF_001030 [Vibrio cholerae TM 11079-80]|nr:hypothetical protein VIF_001030 [Vibrio cholerae TM 11079-80]
MPFLEKIFLQNYKSIGKMAKFFSPSLAKLIR